MSSLYITKGLDGLQIAKGNGEVSFLVFLDLCCFHLGFLSLFETGSYSCASLELMAILLPEPPRVLGLYP